MTKIEKNNIFGHIHMAMFVIQFNSIQIFILSQIFEHTWHSLQIGDVIGSFKIT